MDENLLLTTPMARRLYHDCAAELPLIDYHNHLAVKEIAAGKRFADPTDLWLQTDPYKHRAMRICGMEERRITGNASPYEKFLAWSSVLPKLIGNPLYHWSMLELKRIFDIDIPLSPDSAGRIWDEMSEKLADPAYYADRIFARFPVEYAAPCTTLTDDLTPFRQTGGGLVPSLRGDDLLQPSPEWIRQLETESGTAITNLPDFRSAVTRQLLKFHRAGCRFADHALDNGFRYVPDDGGNDRRFLELLHNGTLNPADQHHFASGMLRFLGREYAGRNWVLLLHIGAERHTSTRLRRLAGPAGGYAGIGRSCDITSLVHLLDDLESGPAGLPQTVLFTLNPADHATFAVLSGSYPGDGVNGKVQLGPAWWYCDHPAGIRDALEATASYGVLSSFIGMTTDSRSLLSLVRHEYFRRVFCAWIGEKTSRGEFPATRKTLENLVRAVCWENAHTIIQEKGCRQNE